MKRMIVISAPLFLILFYYYYTATVVDLALSLAENAGKYQKGKTCLTGFITEKIYDLRMNQHVKAKVLTKATDSHSLHLPSMWVVDNVWYSNSRRCR
jgi:hypothetical protein